MRCRIARTDTYIALLMILALSPRQGHAQAPAFLVKDINRRTVVASSNPRGFTTIGDRAFFVADSDSQPTPAVLWRADANGDRTRLTPGVGFIQHLVNVNGTLFFAVDNSGLWKSNGNPWDTVRVADIPPIVLDSFDPDPESAFVPLGDLLFFLTGSSGGGFELWRSDGTAAGTIRLRRIDPTTGGARPLLRVLNGALLFAAWDEATGYELWRSDGTPQGTVRIHDIIPGPDSSYPEPMAVVGGRLLFGAYEPNVGNQLWSTDGTAQGTRHISNADPWRGNPNYYAVIGDTLYFAGAAVIANSGYVRLWRSDGTAAGTSLVDPTHVTTGVFPWPLTAVGNKLFFAGQTEDTGTELWISDGTAAGTRLVRDIIPGPEGSFPQPLGSANGLLYFRAGQTQLWRSDGTAAGTVQLSEIDAVPYEPRPELAVLDSLVFFHRVVAGSAELWRTDGTSAGTVRLAPTVSTYYFNEATLAAGDTVVFFAGSDDAQGLEPWTSDGTAAGTMPLANLAPDTLTQSASPYGLTDLNGILLFFAGGGDSYGLWRSDGTEAGTVLLKNGASGGGLGAPLPVVGNLAYFDAYDQAPADLALWKTDGTMAGTQRVASLGPSAGTTLDPLTSVGETIFFAVNFGDTTSALWKSDGTADGTVKLKDFGIETLRNFVALDGILYFTVTNALWRSDGTGEGTVRVADLSVGASGILNVAVVDRTLFIGITNQLSGALWVSDGTAAGTAPLPGFHSSIILGSLRAANGLLFCIAYDINGFNPYVWRSDGTDAGTFALVPMSFPAVPIAAPFPSAAPHWGFHPLIWYAAVLGDDLWYGSLDGLSRTDGTVEGSVIVRPDVFAGSLTNIGGSLLFDGCTTADVCGEPWRSDGTAGGTRMVADIAGPLSSDPAEFTTAGSLVFFAADTVETGRELWAIPLADLDNCGNGQIDPGETCDDGGETASCDADCTPAGCGDGYVNHAAGEQCDAVAGPDTDCCTAQCQLSASGSSCTDGDACNGTETCDGSGHCLAGAALQCADDESRTIDSCDTGSGCLHRCIGDCDRSGATTIDEVVAIVGLALSPGAFPTCQPAGDANLDGAITIDEIIRAVSVALLGCPPGAP